MKKILLLLASVLFFSLSAQKRGKDYSNILKSNNIYEINAFLRDAHPDDPRRSVLKPRVMEMMKEYIKNAHPADQKVKDMQEMLALLRRRPSTKITFDEMNAIIKQKQIAKYKAELAAKQPTTVYTPSNAQNTFVVNTSANAAIPNAEAEEFNMLMAVSPVEHQNRTVKILNSLFDNDPNAKESIVMIQNKSDCNIIVRMEGVGTTKYRLAVPAHGDGSIVIQKGQYLFTSLVCGAQYASQKTIQGAIVVALGSQ
ncbi:DUF6759 domain-containing protein [Chryseobacterium arthrosphaerae]|uniref:DUF6759 domain-containing protein n=1 Tax=Chryseobacterium arthrosphaerae TaxID=651561 RepID=A0A1B8ZVD6_9FLAO|nr:DUF6759 domain-containing protein [Chryseobacterium arthrosphaerae]AYZ14003.1 hypothetical protein EGY05_19570 [Chryseobacterium arthrosphaerae]MDG4652650.1 hypothetical protein [Chryseobacterium arthrosphaerae]OCA75556.1 hypothetical protein BBI00_15005 [Chryseobacterium arthrosphaerae]QUY54822.1 hypothetical protein I2F65_18365 [Chryseobacterium arthrosphaerae]RTZ50075.1 hypothetical protein EJ377_08430 [Chryseobacterium arthrosphaerae]